MRRCILLLLLVFSAFAHGGTATKSSDPIVVASNLRVILSATLEGAVTSDGKASGTNIKLGTTLRPQRRAETNPTYDGITLNTAVLKLDGVPVATTHGSGGGSAAASDRSFAMEAIGAATLWCGPGAPDPPPTAEEWVDLSYAVPHPDVRFAATHFADGGAIPVRLETTWDFLKNGAVVGTATANADFEFTANNKLLAWKTTKMWNQDLQTWEDWSLTDAAIINGVMTAGHSAYTNAHYASIATTNGADLLTFPEVFYGGLDGTATALFANSHGGNGEVMASYPSNFLPFLNRWKNVAQPVGYAINAFYACETMITSDADNMNYQGGSPPPGQWIDAGRVGFRATVYPEMRFPPTAQYPQGQPTNHTLAEHAEKFFQALSDGYTLDKARRIANLFVFGAEKPSNAGYSSSTMLLLAPTSGTSYSDPYATLRYVYLFPGERSGPDVADTRWYYALP